MKEKRLTWHHLSKETEEDRYKTLKNRKTHLECHGIMFNKFKAKKIHLPT